ncbi:MAG: NAD(P)/FAD-dependent oxidoreductase [Magnetococcales bacterium]|nr:NAD(P)/FAD-dependent oxidoreductase [Magnetococcales bacterium]
MNPPRKRLVVIGNGMAAVRTLEELLERAPGSHDITVLGAEPHGGYNRILLSPVLSGEKEVAQIVTHPLSWYEERGITLHTGVAATAIDRERGVVHDDRGGAHPYDNLLLATGSHAVILPLPGHDLPGVVTFRDLKDVETMVQAAATHKRAAVIGGGLLGLEAAMGLLKRGMEVTVVHQMAILMERQLDTVAAALLREELEERGLRFHMNARTEAILGSERVEGLRFQDGSLLEVDLVVMAVGVRPNCDLAKAAGLHCERGVVVDDRLVTSDERILAVGECVQHRNTVYGLVAPLYEQGRVLARRLANAKAEDLYTGSMVSTRLKVTDVDLFSAGDFLGDASCEEIVLQDRTRRVYKKLVVKEGRIRGAVLLGDTLDGPWYLELMRDGADITPMRDHLLFGQTHPGDAGHGSNEVDHLPDHHQVCGCNGVSRKTIVEAITGRNLSTLEEVKSVTKASASCGSCTGMVEKILAATLGGDYCARKVKPLCGCTPLTSDGVREAVRDRQLTGVDQAMVALEWTTPDGCPTCRQALNYYIAAFWPEHYRERPGDRFINERIHANIQKDGTYSVVPRLWGGTTTPDQLRVIADVAERFAIPEVKFTGGQRLTLLGIKKEDLPAVWKELGRHDLVSGHAYGKAMRTVKTCVGNRWCRFGTQDSESMGVVLEKMLWNSWTPHKFKMAVSGCPRNCAEATIKDLGVVAVESGWEIHVGGNGGIKVRATDFLCRVDTAEEVLEYAGAFLQLYRREARYLERAAPWVERIGIDWIRQRLVEDAEGRQALYAAFRAAHETLPDPWEQRASHGVADSEFKPLVILDESMESAA